MVDEEEITGTIPIGDAKTDQHYHKIERFHHLLQADAERRKTHLARRLSQLLKKKQQNKSFRFREMRFPAHWAARIVYGA